MKKVKIIFLRGEQKMFEKQMSDIPKMRAIKAIMWWTECDKAIVSIIHEGKDCKVICDQTITLKEHEWK